MNTSQENFLNRVIREVDKSQASAQKKSRSSSEKIVIIDKKKKEIKASIPLLFTGNIGYYIVSNTNNASNLAERSNLSISVVDFERDQELDISISYRVSCDPGNEEKIVKALCSDNLPDYEFDNRIRKWVADFTRDRATEFIENYLTQVKELKRTLQEKAINEIGLRLEVRISRDRTQAPHLVSSTYDPLNIAQQSGLTIPIKDVANNRMLNISVDYQASYDPQDQQRVAQILSSDKPVKEEIDRKIAEWVAEFTRIQVRPADFIDNYATEIVKLQHFLQQSAKDEMALKLDLRLYLTHEKELEPLKIGRTGPAEITVYLSDSDDPFDLQIETELLVDEANEVKAITSLGNGGILPLVKLTKDEIKKFLLKQITVRQFYYELKDTVRNGLANHLDQVLGEKGRRVGHLYLDSKAVAEAPVPDELIEIKHDVKCRVQNYPKLVAVENTLQMLPKDIRKYVSAQSPNLKAWVKSELDKIVKPLLLGKRYIEILVDFSEETEKIRKEMQREAESIGYRIEHIVSIPYLEHSELKRNFEIEEKADDYSTNTASITVGLKTTVNAKFETFDRIEEILAQKDKDTNKKDSDADKSDVAKFETFDRIEGTLAQEDKDADKQDNEVDEKVNDADKQVNGADKIKNLMSNTVGNVVRETLRTIDPERFYMRFYEPVKDDKDRPPEKSVEQELKDIIKTVLESRFGATVEKIVPIPEQTDIIKYLQRLMGMVGHFTCEVPSLTGGEPIQFQGDFKIHGIEQGSWYTFQSGFQSMRESQEQLIEERFALEKQHTSLIKEGDIEDNQDELQEINKRIREIEAETCGIDDLQKSIEKSINAKLITVDSKLLGYTDVQLLSTIERHIDQWARESVIEQYGLEVSIRNLSRSRTEQEEYLSQARQRLEKARVDESLAQLEARTNERQRQLQMSSRRDESRQAELDKLYEQRAKLIADADADDDEREYLDEQIDRLEQEALTPSLEDAGDSLSLLEPKRAKGKHVLAFKEQMSLPEEANSPEQAVRDADVVSEVNEDAWLS